jgi:hypothetical protein
MFCLLEVVRLVFPPPSPHCRLGKRGEVILALPLYSLIMFFNLQWAFQLSQVMDVSVKKRSLIGIRFVSSYTSTT